MKNPTKDELIAVMERNFTADELIAKLESIGLGWSLDHTARLIEARIWDWPFVLGRYRPAQTEPLDRMLRGAIADAIIEIKADQN